MTIETVPLASIQPPTSNPRSAIEAGALKGLAASIRQDGLLQNLVVRAVKGKGKRYRIVSGERRFRALKLLREQGDIAEDYAVPVEIRSGLSADETLRIATVENVQRENLPPLDEAAAFAKLIHKGASLEDIAAQTGLSQTTIKRRVVLNDLCDEAKTALAAGDISLALAEALTLGTHEAQQYALEEIERGCLRSADDIRDCLIDDRPCVAMAIFPVENYNGTLTTDLFAAKETSYFDDAEQFLALQKEAVEALAKHHTEAAAWVEVTDSYRIPDWQYREAEDGEPSGVVINLSPSGRVEVREGLAKPAIDRDTAAAAADNPIAPKKPKAAYGAPLRRYMAWHKTLAVQEALLSHPRKAREVAVIDRLMNLDLHGAVSSLSQQDGPGSAYAVIAAQVKLFAAKLGFAIEDDEAIWFHFPPRFMSGADLYEAVKGLSDDELDEFHSLLAALAFGQVNCEQLDTEISLFNAVAVDLDIDMRSHWRPDRSFFERRTKGQLCAIAEECGYREAVGAVTSFKKTELVIGLVRHFENAHAAAEPTEAQIKARDWLPEAMQFPAIDPDSPAQEQDEPEADEAA